MLVARRASNALCNPNCPNGIKGTANPRFSFSIPNREKRLTEPGCTVGGLTSAHPAAYWGSGDWRRPGKITRKDIQGRRCKIILIGLSLQRKGGTEQSFLSGA